MRNKFIGYNSEITKFLTELTKNNNKEWFDENRNYYEKEIRDNSKNLVSDLSYMFADANLPYIADPKKALFRMNRDIRFSSNKDPYKTNIGMFFPFSLFQSTKKSTSSVGLYFHIDAEQIFVAGGVPYPDNETLGKIRAKISSDWEELLVLESLTKLHFDNEINLTPALKNVPRGYDKTHPAADLLKRKDFGYTANIEYSSIFSESIKNIIYDKSQKLAAYLEYFRDATEG